jgi:DNA ligase-associated metallophosphoesterase
MSLARFTFAGIEVIACISGALYLPEARTLVVSDLHLEKGSRGARRGRLLPPYDSRATLAALAAAIVRHAPRRVVCLGDNFDDDDGSARLSREDAAHLRLLVGLREWIWIAGNHDPAPPALGGMAVVELSLGPFVLRHAAAPEASGGEISGHFHPKAAVRSAGRRFSARCFVSDGERLILPAFGAYAGGLDVFAPALAAVLKPAFVVHLLGRKRIHTLSADRLVGGACAVTPAAAAERR